MLLAGKGWRPGIVLGGLAIWAIPVVVYCVVVGGTPEVTSVEARRLVSAQDSSIALVDVRSPEAFAKQRIRGAVNWPLEEVLSSRSAADVPAQFQNKRLLMVCNSGLESIRAVRKLRRLGLEDTWNLRDGMAGYLVSGKTPLSRELVREALEGTGPLPLRDSPLLEQWVLFLTGFVVKPAYMLLSFVFIVLLWRKQDPDLAALRWCLEAFLLGEAACAANYLVFNHQSHLSEYLHSFGMVLTFAFGTYALLESIDTRVVKFSDPEARCALLNLCKRCYKQNEVSCALKRLFMFLIPSFFVLSFMPFCVAPKAVSYNTNILLTYYNFTHPVIYQIFEIRYCPLIALLFFAMSFFVLTFKKHDPVSSAKVFFAAGMGGFGFCFLRLILFGLFADSWFNSWEEITELILVLGVGIVLWEFRGSLLLGKRLRFPSRDRHAPAC